MAIPPPGKRYVGTYGTPLPTPAFTNPSPTPAKPPEPTLNTLNKAHITYGAPLGEGHFGVVYKGEWKRVAVAIKTLKPQNNPHEESAQKDLFEEAKLVSRLAHPYIVRIYGVVEDKETPAIIFEYISGGTLDNYLSSPQEIQWERRYSLATNIASGTEYLHTKNIIHRDIKSPNILITEQYEAKISDFGISKERHETKIVTASDKALGSICWMPPELFDPDAKYSKRTDIYSLAVVLWEIASRQKPWAAITTGRVGIAVSQGHRPQIPEPTPPKYKALIEKSWHQDPHQRPTAEEIATTLQKHHLELTEDKTAPKRQLAEERLRQKETELTKVTEQAHIQQEEIVRLKKQLEELQKPTPATKIEKTLPSAPIKPSQHPPIAFGAAQWKTYFGDVGAEPPLPPDIEAILNAPCPFWRGKKVQETHLLTLIPATVDGRPLTLKRLEELVQKPLQGNATQYRYFDIVEYTDRPAPKSHWALITRDVIEGSRNKPYTAQQKLVQPPYEVPTVLDAAVTILMEYVKSGTRLYSDSPWTYTRCKEKWNKEYQLVVGGFSAAGLYIGRNDQGNEFRGIGSLRIVS